MKTSKLTYARRLIPFFLLWGLLYVCTFIVLVGWGREQSQDFWDTVAH